MKAPENHFEALTQALYLAVTAPDDERQSRAIEMANDLAINMTSETVDQAKTAALDMINQ